MSKVVPITLNAYMDQTDISKAPSLYVINRTAQSDDALGNVAFNCLNDLGQHTSVTIPATSIPIDLTSQVPAENLIKSAHFRRILEKGQAKIISTKSAEEYIATSPRYREEYDRVHNLKRKEDEDFNNLSPRRAVDNAEEIDLDRGISAQRDSRRVIEGDDVSKNMFVNAFIVHCNDDNYTDSQLESEFFSKGLTLPRSELIILQKYVSRQAIRDLIVQALDDLPEGE